MFTSLLYSPNAGIRYELWCMFVSDRVTLTEAIYWPPLDWDSYKNKLVYDASTSNTYILLHIIRPALPCWYFEIGADRIGYVYINLWCWRNHTVRVSFIVGRIMAETMLSWDHGIQASCWFIVTHYNDVIMTTMASQITSLTVVYSIVYSDADQRKHQSSASLAFVRGIHRDRWIPIWWRHHALSITFLSIYCAFYSLISNHQTHINDRYL